MNGAARAMLLLIVVAFGGNLASLRRLRQLLMSRWWVRGALERNYSSLSDYTSLLQTGGIWYQQAMRCASRQSLGWQMAA